MKRTLACVLVALACGGNASAQVSAEPWFRGGTVMITAEIGGAAFTDFERSRARPVDGSLGLNEFDRRVSARTSFSAGAWIGWWFADGWGIRAGMSWTPTRFRVWNDEMAQQALQAHAPASGEPTYSSLGIWSVHGALLYRFPHSFGRVVPYAIAGGSWISYHPGDRDELPPEALTQFDSGELERAGVLAGIGAAIPLQREDLIMTFELTDHIARTPLRAADADTPFELAGFAMQLERDGADRVSYAHNVRLAFGLTLPIR